MLQDSWVVFGLSVKAMTQFWIIVTGESLNDFVEIE